MNKKDKKMVRKVVDRFLTLWKTESFASMKKEGVIQKTWLQNNKTDTEMKLSALLFLPERAVKMERVQIQYKTSCRFDASVYIELENGTKCNRELVLIKELGPYKPHFNGMWGVSPVSASRQMEGESADVA